MVRLRRRPRADHRVQPRAAWEGSVAIWRCGSCRELIEMTGPWQDRRWRHKH